MSATALASILAELKEIYEAVEDGDECDAIDALSDTIDRLSESIAAFDRFDPAAFAKSERDRQMCDWRAE